MKRTILLFFSIILLVSTLSVGVSAEETEYTDPMDSRNIPSEVLDMFGAEETDLVIRFYMEPMWDVLIKPEEGIDYYVNRLDTKNSYYVHVTETGRNYWIYGEDGWEMTSDFDMSFEYAARILHEFQTGEAIKAVSPDITVQSMYFFNGKMWYEPSTIIYKTNLGNYVYYYNMWKGEFLFSEDIFWGYHTARVSAKREGFGTNFAQEWDLSAYDFRSSEFNPHELLVHPINNKPTSPVLIQGCIEIGIALLVAGAVFCFVRFKKYRHSRMIAELT